MSHSYQAWYQEVVREIRTVEVDECRELLAKAMRKVVDLSSDGHCPDRAELACEVLRALNYVDNQLSGAEPSGSGWDVGPGGRDDVKLDPVDAESEAHQ